MGCLKPPKTQIEGTELATLPSRTHPCAISVALTSIPGNTASQISCHNTARTLLVKHEAVYPPSLRSC